jgi:hypothetical protein
MPEHCIDLIELCHSCCGPQGKAALFKDLHAHPLLPNKTVDDDLAKERQLV